MRWTRKTIIVEIQRLHKAGTELNYAAAESNYLNLVRAAAWHFGTWRRAVEQAGIDYESLSKYQRWDRRRIISRIRELHETKADLSWRSVSTEVDPPLAAAALRPNGFASWRDAIAAAGLNIDEVARYRNWTSEQVLREIKALHRAKQPLSSKAIQTSNQPLFCAARRRFGSWDAALAQAGLNAGKIRLRQPADRRLELGLVSNESAPQKRGRSAKALLNGHAGTNGQVKIAAGASNNAAKGGTSRRKNQPELPLAAAKTRGRAAKAATSSQAVLELDVPVTGKATAAKKAPGKVAAPTTAVAASKAKTPTAKVATKPAGKATAAKAVTSAKGATAAPGRATKSVKTAVTPAAPTRAGAKKTGSTTVAPTLKAAKSKAPQKAAPKAPASKAPAAKKSATKAAPATGKQSASKATTSTRRKAAS